jgi:hypothetical protein
MKRSVYLFAWIACFTGSAAFAQEPLPNLNLAFELYNDNGQNAPDLASPIACGSQLTMAPNSTKRIHCFATLSTDQGGRIGGWSISISGSGDSIRFGQNRCTKPCQSRQIFGDNAEGDEVFFQAPVPLQPPDSAECAGCNGFADKEPTDGPLAGMGAQGPGFVDGVALTIEIGRAVKLPVGKFRILSFWIEVKRGAATDPQQTVSLTYKDGLQATGNFTENSINVDTMAIGFEQGLTATGCNFIIPGGVVVEPCPATKDNGFYFGNNAKAATYAIGASDATFPISMRTKGDSLGFSMGVQRSGNNITFADDVVGQTNNQGDTVTIELLIIDTTGNTVKPTDLNTATGPTHAEKPVTKIEVGAALAAKTDDSLVSNLNPTVGGPGFTVGYVVDIGGSGEVIPATGTGDMCPAHEILIVTIGGVAPPTRFSRGDVNSDERINIADPIIAAQNIFLNRIILFNCQKMLDANDDGQLNGADPVALLNWIFLGANNLAAPFRTCGTDPTEDDLTCEASNCE